ncbi:MAG: type I-B CRISPR-associated protein Cas7/Cst2/DevR [Mollicutes bacterium]|nr:type I-B CRISPR-associated protein Cas7/Cst2/DevR [Mollicutes bacterium]
MNKNSLTLTVVSNMTSNYSEGLGNIASVQKVFKNRKVYAIRSRESLKNAIMIQSGLYDDLQTEVDGATQKLANEDVNVSNCKALEGGYMSTKGSTYVRKSSFYLTDAISTESFVNETRFHNNLFLANNKAKELGVSVQEKPKDAGLMPYQYEYDKSLKVYSITIDLEMIGKDENFNKEADKKEKAERVNSILNAIKNLSLVVKGNLDNSEPVFIVGGLSERKTHYFENVVKVEEDKLDISEDLIQKVNNGYNVGLLRSKVFENEAEIIEKLSPKSIDRFFKDLMEEVSKYYGI